MPQWNLKYIQLLLIHFDIIPCILTEWFIHYTNKST